MSVAADTASTNPANDSLCKRHQLEVRNSHFTCYIKQQSCGSIAELLVVAPIEFVVFSLVCCAADRNWRTGSANTDLGCFVFSSEATMGCFHSMLVHLGFVRGLWAITLHCCHVWMHIWSLYVSQVWCGLSVASILIFTIVIISIASHMCAAVYGIMWKGSVLYKK